MNIPKRENEEHIDKMYIYLNKLFNNDLRKCVNWLSNHNYHLGIKPIELIKTKEGINRILKYLEVFLNK